MDDQLCKIFEVIWKDFPDTLDSGGKYQFNDNEVCETYCNNNCENIYCKTDNDKIMAGWISLIKTIYGSDLIKNDVPNNMNINEYIIIWLIYMLNLKGSNTISNLNETCNGYINEHGGHSLVSTIDKDYNDIIKNLINNKNYLVDMDKNIISKFYSLLKSLCSMYNDINKDTANCTQFLQKGKEFVGIFEKLNNDSNNTEGSSHRALLSSLSTDYDNFKKYCNEKCNGCSSIPPLPATRRTQVSAHISENTSPGSSIASKLIPALLIFAIPIFLGIAYKYSLFEFDKRLQRQYIREKIKKIKNKMKLNI
ncbi:CIR protein PIR protein [Plasmodium vinckei brucechwatti]|uniref:CIR protein PIR protein n=1 Tax=Plasmodium vinckei brucechwatti TaxID=119398 RepID=A0A6V7RUE1_PLAVN|nr:CIR protein PIR protein [Plasmodium vinckei brucechwatti]